MTKPPNDIHSKTVENWLRINVNSLTQSQQIQILEEAILAIELRACTTLSSVTLRVVLERILQQTKEKFPILSKVSVENHILNFKEVDKEQSPVELADALAFILVELLRVIGRLTADILTTPLHKELMKVTSTDSRES